MKIEKQTVMSQKSRTLVGSYTTKSGQVKNRYRNNPNAKPLKTIQHSVVTADK